MLTALRIVSLFAWGGTLLYMLSAVVSIWRGKAQQGDPARLVSASFAVVVMGFNLRALVIPENAALQAALYVLSIAVAGFACVVAHSSGRGIHG